MPNAQMRCEHPGEVVATVDATARLTNGGPLWELRLVCCSSCAAHPSEALGRALLLADLLAPGFLDPHPSADQIEALAP